MNSSFYLVAGLGKTGHSIAAYLQRHDLPFMVFDTRKEVEGLDEFINEFPGVEIFLGELPANVYTNLKEIIVSPGIPLEEPFLIEARRLNIPVCGDIEWLARSIKAPVIAITGTNGKSTVTTLVGEMAKAAGFTTAVAGNIGLPVLDLLDDERVYDLWVLELSSFQLDLIDSLKPVAATVLNISPDHLDRHHTLEAYISSKQQIYKKASNLLYNREDSLTIPNVSATKASFGLDNPPDKNSWGILYKDGKAFLAHGETCLIDVDQIRIKGKHNWQNALAACALASTINIQPEHMVSVLQNFPGLPHRCQWVRTLDGVDWINDSKGTNIGATISAIAGIGGSMPGKIVLIAGGLGKGADFTELHSSVKDYVRSIVLIGKDAPKIEQALSGVVPLVNAASFEEAIHQAKSEAKSGDVVLLSPACASQDMFRDFNHRGEEFTQLVGRL